MYSRNVLSLNLLLGLRAVAILHLLLSAAIGAGTTKIEFTEFDYAESESEGSILLTIEAFDVINNFSIKLIPLTYQQTEDKTGETLDQLVASGHLLPANHPSNPAENDPNGQQDFNSTAIHIEINIIPDLTAGKQDYDRRIGITDDMIQEGTEGFVVMLEVLEGSNVDIVDGYLRIIIINDDDDVDFEFSESTYTVSEGAGVQDNLIDVNKIGITELDYNVELTVQQPHKVAIVISTPIVTITSSEQSAAFEVEVIDDDIVSGDMTFQIEIESDVGKHSAAIAIKENDELLIGFQSLSLTRETLTTPVAVISGQTDSLVAYIVELKNDKGKEFENVSFLCGEPSCVIEANFNVAELKDGNATVVNGTLEIIGSVAGLEVDPERDNFTAILEPPPAPENLIGVADHKSKHINMSWSPVHAQHFVHQYELLLAIDSGQENQPEEKDQITFLTNHTHLIYENADLDKTYVLKVRAENVFGFSPYSEPYELLPPTTQTTPGPVKTSPGPVHTRNPPPFLWLWVTLGVIFLLLLCCLCIIVCCFLWYNTERERGGKYFPRKKERKYGLDFEKYRSNSPSIDDDDML